MTIKIAKFRHKCEGIPQVATGPIRFEIVNVDTRVL